MEILYHGIDLHSNNFKLHFIHQKDGIISNRGERRIYNAELEKKFIPMLTKNDYVCVEASTGSFAFANKIRPFVKSVKVINPHDFKSIYLSGKKTDKIDALKLAECLFAHVQNKELNFKDSFPEIYIPKQEIIELRSLFSSYELFKRQKTSLTNRIHSLIKQQFIPYQSTYLEKEIKRIRAEQLLNPVFDKQIEIFETQITHLETEMKRIKEMIKELAYKHLKNEISILMSIMGISFFTASAVMADIADINRFRKAKELCSYLRAGMRIDSSNRIKHVGKLNKRSRKLAFCMILQGLNHMVNYNAAYEDFKLRKTKGKSAGKVRCALVRKTIVAIFYMLRNKELWKYRNQDTYEKKLKEMEREIKKIEKEKQSA